MGDIADKVAAFLVPQIQVAMSEATEIQCEQTRELLSTPYPPSSSPGEHPHLRTGNLREGVRHVQELTESAITEFVSFSREDGPPDVPYDLEEGHGTVAERPFAKPMIDRIRREYLPEIASRIQL